MELQEYERKHLTALREVLAECCVLLRSNGDFPLEQPGKIAAYGSGARRTVKGGTGSGEVNSRYFINVEQGLADAGFTVTTAKWLAGYEEAYEKAKVEFRKEMQAEAKAKGENPIMYSMGKVMPEPNYSLPLDGEGDVAVYVLSRISGEGNDRVPVPGDLMLSETEKRDICELNRKYEKFMLVINAGGAMDLSGVEEVNNILVLSQLGVETGAVLADILLGKQNPSGKLTTTWSAWEDYSHVGEFGEHNDTRYREGIYVGYRYFDSVGKQAAFPFGFGLSYTTFAIENHRVSRQEDRIVVETDVTNTGRFPGREVVQVYVSAPQGKLDKPYQELAGFTKTSTLAPDASETVRVEFPLSQIASYDTERAAFVLEAGNYVIRVGNSSVHTRIAALAALDGTVVTCQVKNACGTPDFQDWKPETVCVDSVDTTVPVLPVPASAIPTREVSYQREDVVEEEIAALPDEKLLYANVGALSGSMSIIGSASKNVAGAAGETTGDIPGMPGMVMADGPAGLRLSPRFYRDEKGAHAIGQSGLPASVLENMPKAMQWIMGLLSGGEKIPKNCTVEYQYATAIPIGTAIAQSWNPEVAELCGDIVGDEMVRFGVHLWLAPALNIHRSVLCGRNFEYYSEDPLISGRMAGAVTRGVQAHPGCGTTIKHFCVNNQETNRYGNNSLVSERAMREIYLKGFGICMEESQPKAVMTSYNLLNGVHTAERRDLTEEILRCEFGFRGIVMTDWVVGNGVMNSKADTHPAVQPKLVAAAGGDLFMPGCKADYKNMKRGLQDGSLTRKQLEINASRVYRMAKELTRR